LVKKIKVENNLVHSPVTVDLFWCKNIKLESVDEKNTGIHTIEKWQCAAELHMKNH